MARRGNEGLRCDSLVRGFLRRGTKLINQGGDGVGGPLSRGGIVVAGVDANEAGTL